MCVGRASLNLCRCGCTEAEHEEVLDVLELAFRTSETDRDLPLSLPMKRGKCCGKRLKLLGIEDIKASKQRGEELVLTEPCDCPGFDPLFKRGIV
jgi:hypothetical protein